MFEDADKFLKIAVGLGILAAGLGVGYHYAIYIPDRDQQRIEAEEKRQDARNKLAIEAEKNKIEQNEKYKAEYDSCKSSAFDDYSLTWDAQCKSNGIDKKSKGCSLPPDLADKLNERLRVARNNCLDVFKAQIG